MGVPFPSPGAVDTSPGLPTGPTVSPGNPGGGSPYASAVQPGASQLPQTMTLFLPEERPIPSATLFNPLGTRATTAAETNVVIAGSSIVIPQGCIARIDGVNLYVTNLLGTSNLTFTVLFEGNPIQGLTDLGIFPGVAARVAENFNVFYRVTRAGTLSVRYTNTDGGTYTMGASLSGWFWNESQGRLYMQQGQAA